MAKNIIDLIPTGHNNAIKRQVLLNICKTEGIAENDREMRRQIEQARTTAVILNLSDGRGYFRPGKNDVDYLKHYVSQEYDRSASIRRNISLARNLLSDMEGGRI
jgi:hypothetical protein